MKLLMFTRNELILLWVIAGLIAVIIILFIIYYIKVIRPVDKAMKQMKEINDKYRIIEDVRKF